VAPKPRPLTEAEWQENKRITEEQKVATEKHKQKVLEKKEKKQEIQKVHFKEKNFDIGEKFRLFPGNVGGWREVFDEYVNPVKMVGDLASSLGNSKTARRSSFKCSYDSWIRCSWI
jgi:hypothetical protein